MSSGERTLIWRGSHIGPSSVVGRLPLKPPDCTPRPELIRRPWQPDLERYPPIRNESSPIEYGMAVGSSVEIDLGDLEGDDERELLVSEEVVDEREVAEWRHGSATEAFGDYDELEELLAMSRRLAAPRAARPKRGWARRVFVYGVFLAAFWLANAQLGPWLD